MSPNMLTACMNDPGDDPNNPDPNWNQQYSTFCYTLQYMPGVTTYLDTPVVPVAAFTGPDQFPLDCEYPDGTPRIYSVSTCRPTASAAGPTFRPKRCPPDRWPAEGSSRSVRTPSPSPRWVRSRSRTPTTATRQRGPARPVPTRPTSSSPATSGSVHLGHRDLGRPRDALLYLGRANHLHHSGRHQDGPVGSMGGRQLTVTRDNGRSTVPA